jgi:hypothetical protein
VTTFWRWNLASFFLTYALKTSSALRRRGPGEGDQKIEQIHDFKSGILDPKKFTELIWFFHAETFSRVGLQRKENSYDESSHAKSFSGRAENVSSGYGPGNVRD